MYHTVLFGLFNDYVDLLFLFAGLIADGAAGFASGLAAGLAFAATGFVVFAERFGVNLFDMFHG